ncbi:MAG: CoA pyrophosphatase [Bacteroidetes bacterium]|nr:CoA pyrophosphatase [Bacteroidota bacterium]
MKFNLPIIADLQEELKKPLPGEIARHRLSPAYRPNLTSEQIQSNHPKIGGVLLLLYEKEKSLHFVFIERKKYDGVHSGQMSFPGGKKDVLDKDLIQTALRETEEEIGVPQGVVNILGSLSDLYIPPSNFLVCPTVGFTAEHLFFKPQVEEVERIVEIPLSFFLDEKNVHPDTKITLYDKTVVTAPAFIYNQHVIWGATAIMLSELIFILQRIRNR